MPKRRPTGRRPFWQKGGTVGTAWRLGSVVALVASTSACATVGARSAPAPVALEIPEPPPRAVAPVATEVLSSPDTPPRVVPEATAVPVAPGAPTLAPPAPDAEPADPERPAPHPASPALNLAPSGVASIDAPTVQAALAQTTTDLRRVSRAALTPARRVQYDTAQGFLDHATVALTAGNVTFAHYLGEKAATLVRDLVPE